jgi:hypothetical protein
MPRPKGLPKTGGREQGTPNAVTKEVRELLFTAITALTPRAIQILNSSPDDRFINLYKDLLEYVIPKLQRSENTTELSFKDGLKIGYGDRGAEAED